MGYRGAVETYLVAQIANAISGTSTDPDTLARLAACFECLPPSVLKAIQDYLLCQIINVSGSVTPPATTLNNGLTAYWKLDEAAGLTRVDSGPNGQNLSDNNTVTSAAGIIANAAQFNSGTGNYLEIADTATMSIGAGVSFTFTCWVNLTAIANNAGPLGKWTANPGQREYRLFMFDTGGAIFRWRFQVRATSDAANGTVDANTFGNVVSGAWTFIMVSYDGANVSISVNNGAVDTSAFVGGVLDGTSPFQVGRSGNDAGTIMDGLVDEVGFWKRVLTAAEITELYNAGAGKTCCPFV